MRTTVTPYTRELAEGLATKKAGSGQFFPTPGANQEFWEVRFITEESDSLLELFDTLNSDDITDGLRENSSQLVDVLVEFSFTYHFEEGGEWGILVYFITLTEE